jgi:hypothetical protein
MSPRVSLLAGIPARHRVPAFRQLASYVDLQVIFDSCSEPAGGADDTANPALQQMSGKGNATRSASFPNEEGLYPERAVQLGHNILRYLWSFRPQIVVSYGMGFRSLQAELYCRVSGVPLIIWNESTPHGEGWISGRKRRFRRHFAHVAARFWTNGQESSSLLESYKAAPDRIDRDMVAVDTGLVLSEVNEKFRHERETTRQILGLRGTCFSLAKGLSAQLWKNGSARLDSL